MQRIHRDFTYAPASTDISTPILEVFERRQGVCQDFAHLMLGCLRACGLAARYVSGYLLTRPLPGEVALVGADASTRLAQRLGAWAWPVAGAGLARPRSDQRLRARRWHHVRVAHGRDFGDITPLRGVIRGGGQHTLVVRVTTRLQDER